MPGPEGHEVSMSTLSAITSLNRPAQLLWTGRFEPLLRLLR